MKYILFIVFPWFIIISCNNNKELLNEYKLLYIDLENLYTNGYKSYYSLELNKAISIINLAQGAMQYTGVPSDCAIMGDGFFKIKLGNNIIGYTRNGQFKINEYGELITINEFSLFEPIVFPEYFLPETIKINSDRYIFISIPENNKELIELKIGKINIYKPPTELLEHYKDGIYILKENTDNETIIDDSAIYNSVLELSNYNLLSVLLRMYYILSKPNNKLISNIEFKKELTKSIIDNIINTEKFTIEEYNHRKLLMETTFIPFLRYDY